jgi:hypothetical protein
MDCGPSPYSLDGCGVCNTGDYCTDAGQCKDACPNMECGPSPYRNTSCGTCNTGDYCTDAGRCLGLETELQGINGTAWENINTGDSIGFDSSGSYYGVKSLTFNSDFRYVDFYPINLFIGFTSKHNVIKYICFGHYSLAQERLTILSLYMEILPEMKEYNDLIDTDWNHKH